MLFNAASNRIFCVANLSFAISISRAWRRIDHKSHVAAPLSSRPHISTIDERSRPGDAIPGACGVTTIVHSTSPNSSGKDLCKSAESCDSDLALIAPAAAEMRNKPEDHRPVLAEYT